MDMNLVCIHVVYLFYIFIDISFVLFICVYGATVIGDDVNRRVSIYKIEHQSTSTLGDFRRADIFLPNEVLNLIVRISRCNIMFIATFIYFDIVIILIYSI